jgi:hypothetical protein
MIPTIQAPLFTLYNTNTTQVLNEYELRNLLILIKQGSINYLDILIEDSIGNIFHIDKNGEIDNEPNEYPKGFMLADQLSWTLFNTKLKNYSD